MADDINNNEGMDEAGDAGMPDDLKRLLARAEQGEDGDPDSYNPDAEDEDDEDNNGYEDIDIVWMMSLNNKEQVTPNTSVSFELNDDWEMW